MPPNATPHLICSVLACCTALILLFAAPATAHSALSSADPPADAITTGSISELTLVFGRQVQVLRDSVVIAAPDGQTATVADLAVQPDGLTLVVALAEPLRSATHTVAWRVIGEDGHPIEGSYAITIQAPEPEPTQASMATPATVLPSPQPPTAHSTPAAADRTLSPPPAPTAVGVQAGAAAAGVATLPAGADAATAPDMVETSARWLAFTGIMLAVGAVIFGLVVRSEPEDQLVLSRLVGAGGGVTMAFTTVQLVVHAAVVSGRGMGGSMDGDAWVIVVGGGLFTGTMLRIVGGALVAAIAVLRPRWRADRASVIGMLIGVLALLGSFQFTGHTAVSQPSAVVRVADLAHVLGAAIWTGGVASLAAVAASRRRRDDPTTLLVGRFSVLATQAVVIVGLAGLALAVVELDSLAALVSTGYGRVLLVKLGMVGLIGAVGAYNHTRLVPAIVSGDRMAEARMHRTMRVELTLFPLVLGLTAVLVRLSP